MVRLFFTKYGEQNMIFSFSFFAYLRAGPSYLKCDVRDIHSDKIYPVSNKEKKCKFILLFEIPNGASLLYMNKNVLHFCWLWGDVWDMWCTGFFFFPNSKITPFDGFFFFFSEIVQQIEWKCVFIWNLFVLCYSGKDRTIFKMWRMGQKFVSHWNLW